MELKQGSSAGLEGRCKWEEAQDGRSWAGSEDDGDGVEQDWVGWTGKGKVQEAQDGEGVMERGKEDGDGCKWRLHGDTEEGDAGRRDLIYRVSGVIRWRIWWCGVGQKSLSHPHG